MSSNSVSGDGAHRHAANRPRSLLLTAAVLAAVFAAVFLWRTAKMSSAYAAGGGNARPVEVMAFTVHPESLAQSLEAVGSVEAVQQVVLAPEVPGRVLEIHFEAGARVQKGVSLVRLYDEPEVADHAQAMAAEEFARLQFDRSKELSPTGAESRLTLQQHTAQYDQARASVQQTAARLYQKTIRAPFAGQIGIRRVNVGQYVNAGDPIATLVSLDPLYVDFTLPQQDLSKLAVGGQVLIHSDAFPARSFEARINAIDPMVGSDTRNVSIQAKLSNPGELLRPGMYVTAAVQLPPRPNAIVVPSTAVNPSASGDTVFVVRQGKAELTPVTTGAHVGTRVVVERGLADADVVIADGQLRVQPGAPVNVSTRHE
jgi:membrane fusion protein, multidrug efflux system